MAAYILITGVPFVLILLAPNTEAPIFRVHNILVNGIYHSPMFCCWLAGAVGMGMGAGHMCNVDRAEVRRNERRQKEGGRLGVAAPAAVMPTNAKVAPQEAVDA